MSSLQVQEAEQDQHLGLVWALEQALGLAGGRLAAVDRGVGRRHQDAELEPGPVLLRRPAVRVQQVALVQNGVRDPAGVLEMGGVKSHRRCSAVWCSAVGGGTVVCGTVVCGTVVCGTVACGTRLARTREQRRDRRVPGGQGLAGLEALQLVQRLPGHPDPGAVREVHIDRLTPDADREAIGRLLAPRHLLDLQPAVDHGEHRAAEQQQQRNLARVQAGEVPGRADLQVVGERHGQVELGAAGEAGNHDRHRGELQRLERVGPALGLAEQIVQPLGLGVGVAPPGRLDPDLAPQRDRVDPLAAGLGDPQHRTTSTAPRRTCPRGRRRSRRQARPVRAPG